MFEWTEENITEMMKPVEDIKMGYHFTGDRPVVMMPDASPRADEGASNTQRPIPRRLIPKIQPHITLRVQHGQQIQYNTQESINGYRQAVSSICLSKVLNPTQVSCNNHLSTSASEPHSEMKRRKR